MKRFVCLLLAIILIISISLSGCGTVTNKAVRSEDKYRNYYQIFVNSFCDSNGDETGDIPGIISKLDYLNDGDPNNGDDLGIDGIWLSPIMPSKSYHKYDVEDYMNIDEEFGTLDDFDKLISECNDRGIKVIIDLVLNHSSNKHPFFTKACEELKDDNTEGYAKYYNISDKSSPIYNRPIGGTHYYYEGPFSVDMPDWNLSYEGTRKYFEEVAKFWIDRGVAGFRLDAVKYFTDANTDGSEFLKWFYDMCKSYKDDIYMVGEDWEDAGYTYDYYATGIDSLFNFKFATASGVYINTARSGQIQNYVKDLKKYDDNIFKRNENAINANFLSNHDMVRVGNNLEENEYKFAAMLYMLSPGNSFTYYGEEIGIEAPNTSSDASYRTAMIFDNDNLPDIYVNGVSEVKPNELGGVKQQLEQENSLLNTYRELIKIKLSNPWIARGKISDVVTFNEPKCAGYIEEYDGNKYFVIYNGNNEETSEELSDVGNVSVLASMVVTETGSKTEKSASVSSGKITLPPFSVALCKIG